MYMYYKNISWDRDDLESCKQTVNVMLIQGISLKEILQLDAEGAFGNLDTITVLEEFGDIFPELKYDLMTLIKQD